jgi:DNA-binding transcriptional LysR family regulator
MNWDDLRIFLAVAREGSISGAARVLEVQHSTVSRRMRALEEKLGVKLMDRKQDGYVLTAAGQRLQGAAEKMEHELLRVDGAIVGKDTQLKGELRVTAINNMASTVLMPLFARFSRQHPQVQLHITTSNSYISLPRREADIAIRMTNTPAENLIGKRLVTVASTIYGSRDYIAQLQESGEKPVWLGVECCGFHQTWTRAACGDKDHYFYSDDTLLTRAALKQQLGLAYLPCFLGDEDPDLARYAPPDPELNLGLWLLFHPDLRHNARVLAFREHMLREVDAIRDVFEGSQGAV